MMNLNTGNCFQNVSKVIEEGVNTQFLFTQSLMASKVRLFLTISVSFGIGIGLS